MSEVPLYAAGKVSAPWEFVDSATRVGVATAQCQYLNFVRVTGNINVVGM